MRKLQLGTGTNPLEGWFNTDLEPASRKVAFLDSTTRFPFQDASFRYVLSEHHIEHLTYGEGLFMLEECHRILAPGGKIRVATPSLEVLIGLYTPKPNRLQERYLRFIVERFLPQAQPDNPAFVINNAFRNWGHQFVYDRRTLREAMETAGFVDVVFHAPGESADEQLRGVEMHGRFVGDEEMNRFETIVAEAGRPA